MTRRLATAMLGVLLALVPGPGSAQTGRDGTMAKLHQSLIAVHGQHAAHLARGSAAPFRSDDVLIRLVGDRVVVDAVASGDANALRSDLEALGMQGAVAFGRVVSGLLPVPAIPAAAALASLRFAQPAAAMAGAGSVTSEGDHAMRADVARTTSGVDGTGVAVGVLSDSFDCKHGAAVDVNNGDLSPVTVLQEGSCLTGTDEGRAMLQVVHDVAPGASLLFASGFNGMASFAANIQALAAAGARVIADDVFYFAEPFFQDGIIAQAVDRAVANGVTYFVLAGNDGRLAYDHAFVPGQFFPPGFFNNDPAFLGGTAHDFGGGNFFQRITLGPNATAAASFQWDSPFFSAGGAPTLNDVDVYLLNVAHTAILGALTTDNIVSGDALEFGSITNPLSIPVAGDIMIVNRKGPNPGRIKYKFFQSPSIAIQFATNSGTIAGHENARGAETVGAAAYSSTPEFGVSPPVKELFSSSGTTPILFDLAGNRLATPDPRSKKPGIVAPDRVATTVPALTTFTGTSAAAPHAAGVAALLLQARPGLAPAQVYTAMEATAIDMAAPGLDTDTGFGLIQANDALTAIQPAPVSLAAAVLPGSRARLVGTPTPAFATILAAGSGTAMGCTIAPITNIPASFSFQTTDSLTNLLTGTPDTFVNIPAGGGRTFVVAFQATAPFPSTDVQLAFSCLNTSPAPVISGVSTLLLTASSTPLPDVVALGATPSHDGIVNISGPNGAGVFAAATTNVGLGDQITVSADTGGASLPLSAAVCQTNPVTGQCVSALGPSVTVQIDALATPTFAVFIQGSGAIAFDPAVNRVFLRFKTANGTTVGSTSAAVRTQ